MKIAIASGKGGTGKTTVAVNLALSAPDGARLLDCDVEEPNCHIFMNPEIETSHSVAIQVPHVTESACTACGECADLCQFNAIVSLATTPLVFPELCHGCGGCVRVCPAGAIEEVPQIIGSVACGVTGKVTFVQGRLNVGHPMSPPVIRAVKQHILDDAVNIIDCPPGTSCPAVAALKDADMAVLVTEPTPFGLHDLTLAVEMVRVMDIPVGVVINRSDIGDDRVVVYCERENIPVLMQIPDERRIAEAYSRGIPAVTAFPEMRKPFAELLETIMAGRMKEAS